MGVAARDAGNRRGVDHEEILDAADATAGIADARRVLAHAAGADAVVEGAVALGDPAIELGVALATEGLERRGIRRHAHLHQRLERAPEAESQARHVLRLARKGPLEASPRRDVPSRELDPGLAEGLLQRDAEIQVIGPVRLLLGPGRDLEIVRVRAPLGRDAREVLDTAGAGPDQVGSDRRRELDHHVIRPVGTDGRRIDRDRDPERSKRIAGADAGAA